MQDAEPDSLRPRYHYHYDFPNRPTILSADRSSKNADFEAILVQGTVKLFYRLDGMDGNSTGESGLNNTQSHSVQPAGDEVVEVSRTDVEPRVSDHTEHTTVSAETDGAVWANSLERNQ